MTEGQHDSAAVIRSRDVVGILQVATSLDAETRIDGAGLTADRQALGSLDVDDAAVLAVVLTWTVRIESSPKARMDFFDSLFSTLVLDAMAPHQAAALMAWMWELDLDVTEEDYEAWFAEAGWDQPDPSPPDPRRAARGVDLVRGMTSTLAEERARAADLVPAVLDDFSDPAERTALAGVLTHALLIENLSSVRTAQAEALRALERVGAMADWQRALLDVTGNSLGPADGLPGFD